jgi:hypothetical protein
MGSRRLGISWTRHLWFFSLHFHDLNEHCFSALRSRFQIIERLPFVLDIIIHALLRRRCDNPGPEPKVEKFHTFLGVTALSEHSLICMEHSDGYGGRTTLKRFSFQTTSKTNRTCLLYSSPVIPSDVEGTTEGIC